MFFLLHSGSSGDSFPHLHTCLYSTLFFCFNQLNLALLRYWLLRLLRECPVTVRTGCREVSITGANIIFIEKRRSFPRACVGDKPRCLIRARTKGRHFGARPTSSVKREMKAACRLCDLSVGYAMLFSRRWMLCCRQRNASTAYLNCMMLLKTKGSNIVSQARFCCLCQRPNETRSGQRQQTRLGSRILLPLPKTR